MRKLSKTINLWSRFRCNISTRMSTLETLKFQNLAVSKLPIDKEERNYVRTVRGACFSKVKPTPVKNPVLVAASPSAMNLLDLSEQEISRREFVEYFSGNKLLPGSEPAAHCYCGHQFGYYSGQLGDGAVIYLGEVINKKDERWEIQLKGAGLTPYSRTADGRKVLRSSIREFLCSEAMHFLGIPTSRAGSCITSDSEVARDLYYDGNNKMEKCTIVLRIAESFIRFGSFEIFKTLDPITGRSGPSVGMDENLNILINYVIDTFYPEISNIKIPHKKYGTFFKEVVLRTARLVALWQSVGFCHGVLNTDNMSILGLTLDYGPFGFLDMYNPNHICNASDEGGRYTYAKQPEICAWNLKKLAEAIKRVLPSELSSEILELFESEFQSAFMNKMQDKLGLLLKQVEHEEDDKDADDKALIEELFDTMENTGSDFTNTFVCITSIDLHSLERNMGAVLEKFVEQCYSLQDMINEHSPSIQTSQIQALLSIARSNPDFLNQLGDSKTGLAMKRLLQQAEKVESLKRMNEKSKRERDRALWSKWLSKYQQRLEKDMKSYEGNLEKYNSERLTIMRKSNPRYILRNHILQEAIEMAEKGDFSQVRKLMDIIEKPYESSYVGDVHVKFEDMNLENEAASYHMESSSYKAFQKAPDWSFSLKVT